MVDVVWSGQRASYRDPNDTRFALDEALATKACNDLVANVAERDGIVYAVNVHLELTHSLASTVAHVDEVEIKDAELKVASRAKYPLSLGQ
jgi:hypothetical protein